MLLALKLLLAPALVVATSLAGRRWGPRLAGILVCLPITAGPILLIIRLEHGAEFASRAAATTTLAVAPLAVFAVTVAVVSARLGWIATMAISWLAVLLADLIISWFELPAQAALAIAVAALLGAGSILRRIRPGVPTATIPPWWDLPARAVATAALVLLVTGVAGLVGPHWSGVLTPFPIALSVVCGFACAHAGQAGVVALLRGIVPGLVGFALFCCLVSLLLTRASTPAAFGIALAASLIYATALTWLSQRSD